MTNNPTSTAPYPPEVMAAAARLASPGLAHIGHTAAMFRHLPTPLLPGAIVASLDDGDRPVWAALWPDNDAAAHADLVGQVINALTPAAPEGEAVLAGQVANRLMAEGEGGHVGRLRHLTRVYGLTAVMLYPPPDTARLWQAAFDRVIALAEAEGDHESAEVYRTALDRLAAEGDTRA